MYKKKRIFSLSLSLFNSHQAQPHVQTRFLNQFRLICVQFFFLLLLLVNRSAPHYSSCSIFVLSFSVIFFFPQTNFSSILHNILPTVQICFIDEYDMFVVRCMRVFDVWYLIFIFMPIVFYFFEFLLLHVFAAGNTWFCSKRFFVLVFLFS